MTRVMGQHSEWVRLHRTAFGIESEEGKVTTFDEQVRAGLRLYVLTAELLAPVLRTEDRPLITHSIQLIRKELDMILNKGG